MQRDIDNCKTAMIRYLCLNWQPHLLLQASLVDLLPLGEVGFTVVLVDVGVTFRVPFHQVYPVEHTVESIAPGSEHALHTTASFRGLNLPGIPRADCYHTVCTADACLPSYKTPLATRRYSDIACVLLASVTTATEAAATHKVALFPLTSKSLGSSAEMI